jgi:ABC-type methionine transport system ATPase subunit
MQASLSHFLASTDSVEEVDMQEQVVRLIYPPRLLDVPIINQLIRRYELTVNILRAQVGPDEGWVDIQLSGNQAAIEDAMSWLSAQGIEVQRIAA